MILEVELAMSFVNEIFGKNLQALIDTRNFPVSKVAQLLDTSSVQVRRFLRSESHPNPTMLHRIEKIFGVDGRIVTMSLDDIQHSIKMAAKASVLSSALFPFRGGVEPMHLMPCGIYQFWRRSFSQRGMYFRGLFRIFEKSGISFCKLGEVGTHKLLASRVNATPIFLQREVLLILVSGNNNLLMVSGGTGSFKQVTTISMRSAGHLFSNAYVGHQTLHRSNNGGTLPTSTPVLASPITGGWIDLLSIGRQCGFSTKENVPKNVLEQISAGS